MKIFASSNYGNLTQDIVNKLQNAGKPIDIGRYGVDKFSDGEMMPLYKESIRNRSVYIVGSTSDPEEIIETMLAIDAAKRSGAKRIVLVAPYQGYSRQDKTDHLRSSIGSKMLADVYEKIGIDSLLTIDLHASAIQGFYNVPVIHLNGNKIFFDYLRKLQLENMCILAPDQGAVKKATDYCKAFPDATFAMINKRRVKPNEIHSMEMVGDVEGKNVIIVDDIADTFGTMAKAGELIMENGALSVRAVVTHGVLSGPALDRINASVLESVVTSDTIAGVNDKAFICDKLRVISCSDIISKSILALSKKSSIHEVNLV